MGTRAIGIDFGTTKTLVAYLNPREKRPETLLRRRLAGERRRECLSPRRILSLASVAET